MRPARIARWLALAGIAFAGTSALGWPAGPGEKMHRELTERHAVYADGEWQDYVSAIGARLLSETPDAGKEYHFVVIDDAGINAFATEDAYIFVNRGLLAFLKSEDELAAVIGHEIAHVVAKHSKKQKRRDLAGKAAGFIAAAATYRPELMRMSQALTAEQQAGYGREMELEADRLGAQYMATAGYNPLSVIDVVQVLKDQELFSKQVQNRRANYHGLFASHPKNDKRLHDAVSYAQNMLPEQLVMPVGDFWGLLEGLVYGDQAAAGAIRGSEFFHSGLRVVVQFPTGWNITSSQSEVIAKAPGNGVEGTIRMARHEVPKRESPGEYPTKVLQRDDILGGEEQVINGQEAWVGEVDASGSTTPLKLMGVIYKGRDLFLFNGECDAEGDPEKFREAFLATLQGLRPMSAEDVHRGQSNRIQVIAARPGDTYAALAERASISRHAEETLRLLNGGHPHGEPRAGDYVKVVR